MKRVTNTERKRKRKQLAKEDRHETREGRKEVERLKLSQEIKVGTWMNGQGD